MEPPREPSRNLEERPIPAFLFTPSKRPVISSSRPFILHQRISRSPTLNLAFITTQLSQLNQFLNSPRNRAFHRRRQVKCQHCNGDFEPDTISDHLEECEMRTMPCPRCGEQVVAETFDLHAEQCGDRNSTENLTQPRFSTYFGNTSEADNTSMDYDEHGMEDEFFLQEEEFTYERLLMLDETIVKKGMTGEQMKEFPTQLYVKSLDGEGSCSICLSDYETGEYTRKLSCDHKFHKGCIDKWLDNNITCPMCKKYLR